MLSESVSGRPHPPPMTSVTDDSAAGIQSPWFEAVKRENSSQSPRAPPSARATRQAQPFIGESQFRGSVLKTPGRLTGDPVGSSHVASKLRGERERKGAGAVRRGEVGAYEGVCGVPMRVSVGCL